MPEVEIYTKDWCPFCSRAKAFLDRREIPYTEIDVTTDRVRESEMRERSGRRTVPQIFISGKGIGGSDDLALLAHRGELDTLLQPVNA